MTVDMKECTFSVMMRLNGADYQFERVDAGEWASVGDSEFLSLEEVSFLKDALVWLNENFKSD